MAGTAIVRIGPSECASHAAGPHQRNDERSPELRVFPRRLMRSSRCCPRPFVSLLAHFAGTPTMVVGTDVGTEENAAEAEGSDGAELVDM